MLTKNQREWVLTERSRYTKEDTSTKRLYDYKIRKKAREAIEDLTLLARALAPDQHRQIFNSETLTPLTKNLMDYASMIANRERERDKEEKAIVYDDRLFRLGIELGNQFLIMASILIGESYRKLKYKGIRILPTKDRIDDLNILYNAIRTAKTR